ncbi:MAG: hydroxyisourate hydrolase [Candidatus Pseudothioglobus sp.]|nr:hydroxyisourate hydrolase [Candidatus Thioglobus sp.]MBA4732092.1 hydroxyisourate hydrolase [Candidatus Thioglobus sp.]OUW83289.1 MAG: hydroxyisourate hydrolase [Candidatus Thioglobus sp. TMED218]|tara:strand:+ start:6337 stop:6681 length:345 start_codon:yes stop_codon:yes gene_type:complete
MGKLTTHILDTSMGTPAKEVEIKLYKRNDSSLKLINSAKTNEDGRCNEPLLSGNLFEEGCYEIEFNIGHYYATKDIDCPFLKDVVIRFYISNSDENYHVPLLISPFSYSTYRGS